MKYTSLLNVIFLLVWPNQLLPDAYFYTVCCFYCFCYCLKPVNSLPIQVTLLPVLLNIMLYKAVLTCRFVDEVQNCERSNEPTRSSCI